MNFIGFTGRVGVLVLSFSFLFLYFLFVCVVFLYLVSDDCHATVVRPGKVGHLHTSMYSRRNELMIVI
jgi:hypothetical protein